MLPDEIEIMKQIAAKKLEAKQLEDHLREVLQVRAVETFVTLDIDARSLEDGIYIPNTTANLKKLGKLLDDAKIAYTQDDTRD